MDKKIETLWKKYKGADIYESQVAEHYAKELYNYTSDIMDGKFWYAVIMRNERMAIIWTLMYLIHITKSSNETVIDEKVKDMDWLWEFVEKFKKMIKGWDERN